METNKNIPELEQKVELLMAVEKGGDWAEIGHYLGISGNAARKRHKRLLNYLHKVGLGPGDLLEIHRRQTTQGVNTGNFAEDYLRGMGLDPKNYALQPRTIWGNDSYKNASFRVAPVPITEDDVLEIVEKIRQNISQPPEKNNNKKVKDGFLAVFSLYDPHIAKLSSSGDMVAAYRKVLSKLIKETVLSGYPIEKAVLVIGQDFVNFDQSLGTTTMGTPQENGMPWRKAVEVQSSLAIWAVNQLRENFSQVEIHLVPGNHDKYSNFWLYVLLSNLFSDRKDVSIVGGETWSVVSHGNIGIFLIHGDVGKVNDYVSVWATSSPLTFAYSHYKEIHTGHLHTSGEAVIRKSEDRGIVHRSMPGLTSTDTWHNDKLYINNNRLGLVTLYGYHYPRAEFYAFVDTVA